MKIRGKDLFDFNDGTYSQVTFTSEFPADRVLLTEFMEWMFAESRRLASLDEPSHQDGDQALLASIMVKLRRE